MVDKIPYLDLPVQINSVRKEIDAAHFWTNTESESQWKITSAPANEGLHNIAWLDAN
jgi:hypothetical protein